MELQQKTKTDTNGLIPPYGGELKNLIIKDKTLKNNLIAKVSYEFECSKKQRKRKLKKKKKKKKEK
jgi:sulfate adenylyltransferase